METSFPLPMTRDCRPVAALSWQNVPRSGHLKRPIASRTTPGMPSEPGPGVSGTAPGEASITLPPYHATIQNSSQLAVQLEGPPLSRLEKLVGWCQVSNPMGWTTDSSRRKKGLLLHCALPQERNVRGKGSFSAKNAAIVSRLNKT